jgi:hypothetical protein
VASVGAEILLLSSTIHNPQVRSSIVEPIAVDVVDLARISCL